MASNTDVVKMKENAGQTDGQTDGRTDGHQTDGLRLPLLGYGF